MIYVNGIEVNPPEYECPSCGCNELNFKYVESNNSIQMRCAKCGKWYGNYKYDKRTKEEIRLEKIKEWQQNKVYRIRGLQ